MRPKSLHYGWIQVAISALILSIFGTLFFTFGIFLVPLATDFNWDIGALSAALSMTLLIGGGLAIFVGRFNDKYGPRPLVTITGILMGIGYLLLTRITQLWQVYVIFGILMSIALSCCFAPLTSTIPRWFIKRSGVATALTITGFGIGGITWPIIAQAIIDASGWRQAYVILGLTSLIAITSLAQLLRRDPQQKNLMPYGYEVVAKDNQQANPAPVIEAGLSLKQAAKTTQFWVFGAVLFFHIFYVLLLQVHIVPDAVIAGIPPTIAAGILSMFAGANLIGQLFVGIVTDKIGAKLALSTALALGLLALILLLLPAKVWVFYLSAAFLGIAAGSVIPLQMLITADMFGLKFLGVMVATLTFFGTTGGAIGPIFAGTAFDAIGNYSLAFLVNAAVAAISFTFSVILLRYKGKIATMAGSKSDEAAT